MNGDIYDNGIPKYSTARDIYDALCVLAQTEEMGILSEIGLDVSWENQGYYYFDKGSALKEQFEALSGYGNKMWLIDLAITQLDGAEVHDAIYECLADPDLAKRIGFKKLFIESILNGRDWLYKEVAELFYDALHELNKFGQYESSRELYNILEEKGIGTRGVYTYPNLARAVSEKIRNLRLDEESRLVAECRAHLTSYDDFIYGLKVNQALYNAQEQAHRSRLAALQADYNDKVSRLLAAAKNAGLLQTLTSEMERLGICENTLLIGTPTENDVDESE